MDGSLSEISQIHTLKPSCLDKIRAGQSTVRSLVLSKNADIFVHYSSLTKGQKYFNSILDLLTTQAAL